MSHTDVSSTGWWGRAGSGLSPWSPSGRGPSVPSGPGKNPCGCGVCPACTGLASPTRPRFFAGQLLTDAELTELQRYVIEKNKLHNRFLHGWGVVCGLELVCGECGDDLVVRAGYALDPCGNDVVVPSAQGFDIAAAIQACLLAERATPACDPPYGEPPSHCDDEATWCVTVRYREQDIRPITPLAPSPTRSCSCGGASCGCGNGGGNGKGHSGYECTCGAGGGSGSSLNATVCGCSSPAAKTAPAPGCEPTRTIECFELGVCRDDGRCHDLRDKLAGTMPLRILECLLAVSGLFSDRVSTDNQKVGARLALDVTKESDVNRAESAVGQLYDAVAELYERDPLRTRCAYPPQLGDFTVRPKDEGETESAYLGHMTVSAQTLMLLVIDYLRDCVCDALLPPCPPDPCDDRVVLGCVTMKDGKVVEICNHACRRYAGSFVSREHWLPVGPVLTWLAGLLCCFPILGRGTYGGLDVGRLLRAYDPERSARQQLAENDFAAVSNVWARARQLVQRFRPGAQGDLLARLLGERVNLAAQLGKRPTSATRALGKEGIKATIVEVDDPDRIPVRGVGLLPLVRPGARVVAFVHDKRVVGFGPAPEGGGG